MIDNIHCIKGQIHNILTTIRIDGRSTPSGLFSSLVIPDSFETTRRITKAFNLLDEQLTGYSSLDEVDTPLFLSPFIDIVTDDQTSTLVLAALQSIHKFILYSFLSSESRRADETARMMATGLIRLQNENEHVLMKRIELILDFTRSSLGSLLTDREIYDLFKICLKTAISNSNSPLLRIYAENVSNQSILFLFSRLHSKKFTETAQSPKNGKRTAFGLKAINSLMILLTELLNPYRTDLDNDENILRYQLLGLKLIHTALESGGKEMSENELTRNVISDDLCKQLLHCSQTDNSRILSMCLRIVFILFNTSRKTLKTQLEIFITSVHIRIAESKFRSLELKELVFESLNEFANEPDLIAGIFRNYDCELKNNNVFEDIARILSEFALKSVGFDGKGEEKRSFLQVCEISGDALIATMRSIEKKFCSKIFKNNEKSKQTREIDQRIKNKKKTRLAVSSFNEHAKNSIPYLQKLGVIDKTPTAKSIALFLKNSPNLSKSQICAFLSGKNDLAKKTLKEFTNLFNFKNTQIDVALRTFLGSLFLSGESQQILRILEQFSEHYFNENKSVFKSAEVCYVVVSAIIMLNTDLYNDQVKTKIKVDEFVKILKGINGGDDLPSEYIANLFKSIKENELKAIPNDLRSIVSDKGIDRMYWQYIMSKSADKWKVEAIHDNGYRMFNFVWDASIRILTHRIKKCTDERLFGRLAKDINSFANICAVFHCGKRFNKMMILLSSVCIDFLDSCCARRGELSPKEAFSKFGLLHKVLELFYSLVHSYGETYVKESWNNIIFMTMCLSTLKILPEKTFDSEDFKTANGKTFPSLKKSIHSSNKQKSGFFAFFSSTKSDKIKSSEESFNRKTDKIMENLQLEKILQISFRRTSLSTICKVLTSILLDKSIKDVFSYNICRFLNESECIIFCLDRLSDLAERNRSHFDVLWPVIREDLFKILQNMNNVDYLTERAVVNALRIFIVYASIDVPVPTTNNNIDEKNGGRLVQISNTSEMAKILTNLISIDAKLLSFFYDRFVSFLIVLTNVYDYKPFIPPETEVFFAFLAKLAILDKSKTDLILVVDKILSEKIDSKVVLTSADLVVVLSEKTEKLDFKSVEILKKNLEKLSDKRKFVQKEKRNGFLKQLLKANYALLISDNQQIDSIKFSVLSNFDRFFFSEPTIFDSDGKMIKDCLEQIVKPVIYYCYNYDINKSPKNEKSKSLLRKSMSTTIRILIGNIDVMIDRIQSEYGKYFVQFVALIADLAAKFYAKNGDETFIAKISESLKNLFHVCKNDKKFLNYKNAKNENLMQEILKMSRHFHEAIKKGIVEGITDSNLNKD